MQHADMLEVFRALANENRQEILFLVFSDKNYHTVGETAERIGLAQSTTSEHLSILRKAGLLDAEKVDREVRYRVNKKTVTQVLSQMQNWLTCC